MWLPTGGHIDRDELPHEAALREVREETGLEVDLRASVGELESRTARSIPRPQHFLLEDINVHDGQVGHQHVDFVYYAAADTRDIDPAPGEAPADAWRWFTDEELDSERDGLPPDVAEVGRAAIATVDRRQ
jgi:8-oxo-dGTP pyrophosphatase MutT (NUDIX family)